MSPARVVAVDLGASSGRVYAVDVADARLELSELGRFPNGGVTVAGSLHWDILALHRGVMAGLAAAVATGRVDSVGIDSWAVDYGLLRADGSLLANPFHHRDGRATEFHDRVVGEIGAQTLYERSGVALQPFNTVYQLLADQATGLLPLAARALLIPDLLTYWLTGELGTEITNASTTQLLDRSGHWDTELLASLGLPELFGTLRLPGSGAGDLRPSVATEVGAATRIPVVTVASHDTASAVVAVPADGPDFAYISCGTWSLVGVEIDEPVVSTEALRAGFTNERGVGGSVRFLRNVMGLWLLQEAVREWERTGPVDLASLTAAAATAVPLRSLIDVDAAGLLAPGAMPARLRIACRAAGEPEPETAAELTRCILDSLALAYRRAVASLRRLTGRPVEVVHIVGGGVNNRLLCQLTADACGVEVLAGPVEAAALGNALVQAGACGEIPDDLRTMRRLVAATTPLSRYEPDFGSAQDFAAADAERARPVGAA